MRVNLRVSVPTLPVKAEPLCRKNKSLFIVPEEKKTYKSMCDSKMFWGLFVRGPLESCALFRRDESIFLS